MSTGPQPQIEARPDPLIDATLAERYRLTRKIGEGAMGTVYEATQVNIGKTVAVKVLREKFVDRPEVAERLVQEARLASSIRHEHIVDITDSGRTKDGRTFVVMELLDGKSLSEVIRAEAPMPEARAIAVVRQVASALGAAHVRKIVHRDVKPENIFLVERSGQEFVKVLDFGISKSLRVGEEPDQKSLRLTQTGMVLGTPLYMSPEQARGDEDLDHRIDIYALGVILYECLTGEVPFRGTNYNGIIAQVARAEPTPLRALRPELRISEAVERVVMKAMAKARGDRYATMEAFEADLGRVVAGETIEAPAAPARRPWLAISVGVGIAVLIATLAGVLMLRRTKNELPVAAPAPPPPAPVAVVAPAPNSVVVHVETMPPGAEVRQGDRVFGPAPRDLLLPRTEVPAKLTFHLDGYEVATAQVVPLTDDAIRVKLSKSKKPASVKKPAAPPLLAPQKKPGGETLPNPY